MQKYFQIQNPMLRFISITIYIVLSCMFGSFFVPMSKALLNISSFFFFCIFCMFVSSWIEILLLFRNESHMTWIYTFSFGSMESLHGTNVHLYSEHEFWNVRWSCSLLKILYWSQMRICLTDSLSSVLPKCYVQTGIIARLINKFPTRSILLPK